MDAAQGFSAQGAGAAVILASTHFGFPLSTTHVINGGVMGAGAGEAALRRALGRRREHRRRLAADAAGGGRDRRRDLRCDTNLRHRRAWPGAGNALALSAGHRRLRPPRAAGRSGRPPVDWLSSSRRRSCPETMIASLIAGVGITVVFSIAIWGAARFADLSRSDRPVAAAARGGPRPAGACGHGGASPSRSS